MKIFIFIVLFVVGLIWATLLKNDAHLFQPPGVSQRLKVFLTTNVAETRDKHPFSELKTPVYTLSPTDLYQKMLQSAINLDWQVVENDDDKLTASFIVQSVAFAFKDDVTVRVNAMNDTQSSLYVHSQSRLGRADFAANSAHIQALLKGINKQTGSF